MSPDPADFASLLEREPLAERKDLVYTTHEAQSMNDAGGYSPGTITVGTRKYAGACVRDDVLEEAAQHVEKHADMLDDALYLAGSVRMLKTGPSAPVGPVRPGMGSERERCARELEEYGYPNGARILRSGPDSLDERLKADSQTTALDSAAVRIKSLEGVLVAIRAKLTHHQMCSADRISEIRALITETLDPCKPWCTRDEPGHSGACEPVEQERDE